MTARTFSFTLLGIALLAASPVMAANATSNEGRPACPGIAEQCQRPAAPMHKISPEKIAQIKELREARRTALAPLRQQLLQKRMELRALSPNPNVKPEELKALVAEIIELRGKIDSVKEEFRTKAEKAGLPGAMFKKEGGFHPRPMDKHPGAPRHGGCEGPYHGAPGCWR